jgi:hypothetical protein
MIYTGFEMQKLTAGADFLRFVSFIKATSFPVIYPQNFIGSFAVPSDRENGECYE